MYNNIPNGSLLYLMDARGVYIPQNFAEHTRRECVTNVTDSDWQCLLDGPTAENEWYWEAWNNVLSNARVTDPKSGTVYTVYQDGDCWLVPIDAVWQSEE